MKPVSLTRKTISDSHALIGLNMAYLLEFVLDEQEIELLCKRLKWNKNTLRRLTQGRKELTLSELNKLATFFDAPLSKVVMAKIN